MNLTSNPAETSHADRIREELDELLHDALMQTFPCSDPISISPPESNGHPTEKDPTPQKKRNRDGAVSLCATNAAPSQ